MSDRARGQRGPAACARCAARGLAIAVLLAVASTGSADARSTAPMEHGWWSVLGGDDQTARLLVPPGVPDDGLYVANSVSGAVAYAAVRFPSSSTGGTLTLTLAGAPTGTPVVVACPTTTEWTEASNGPLADAPSFDCGSASAAGSVDTASGTMTFSLPPAMATEGVFDLVITPAPDERDTFSVATEAPADDAFRPADGDIGSVPPAAPTTAVDRPPPPTPTPAAAEVPGPRPVPRPTSPPQPMGGPTPMTVAPVVESGAPPPEPPSEADPANRWVVAIAAAALIAMLAAVAWWATSGRLRFALRSAGRSSIDALAPWRPMPRARIAGATAMLVLVAALAYTQPGGDGADVAADLGGDERTTVDDRQPPTSSGPGGQAASVGPPTAGGAASSASTEGSAAGGATSTTVGASPGSEATRSGPIPIGDGAHGVTDDVVRIGLFVVDSRALDRGAAAVAGNDDAGSSAGNYQTAYDAQIAHINATGGVAGRTLEPVYYFARVEDATTASGRQRMAQEACARWTEDEPVFAMIGMSEELMFDCAARSGTPLVASFLANAYLSRARFAEMSIYWYGPSTLLTETRDTALAGFLAGHDFLGPDARVALMVEDRAMSRASASSSLRPAIEASGATVVQEIRYPDAISSPWPNYVLQMQQARATHVVFGATSGGIWPAMLLMRAAEDQRYRPRWGLGSDNVPDGLITLGNLPASQLKNVLAMGWSPLLDVGDETPQGDNGSRCAEALQSAAQPVSAGSCLEIVFFLQAALARASVLSPAGLAEGAASLGDSYTSPVTVDGRARFGAGDHEGVDVVRAVGFDPAAPGHMVYLGPPEAMPG